MKNEEKANELVQVWCDINHHNKDLARDVYEAVIDMAIWKDSQPQIIEIFGKMVKIVNGDDTADDCKNCALFSECNNIKDIFLCQSADKNLNHHFVEVDEEGNEI